MKYNLLLLVLFTLSNTLTAQEKFAFRYPELYIGKTLTIKASKADSIEGFTGFSYLKDGKLQMFEPFKNKNGNEFTNPEKLFGKVFKVTNVIFKDGLFIKLDKNGPTAKNFTLELSNPSTGTLYYRYAADFLDGFVFTNGADVILPCEFYIDVLKQTTVPDTKASWETDRTNLKIRDEDATFIPAVNMYVENDNSIDGNITINIKEIWSLIGKNMSITLVSANGKKMQMTANIYNVPISAYIKTSYTMISLNISKKELVWFSDNLISRLETSANKTVVAKPDYLQCVIKKLYEKALAFTGAK